MLLATYILNLTGLFFLFGGQFTQVAPVLACLSVLLWIEIFRAHARQAVGSGLFWLWLVFLGLVAAQLFNPGRTIPMPDGRIGLVLPAWTSLPWTLKPQIAFAALVSWSILAGLCVAGQFSAIRERKEDIIRWVLICAVLLAAIGIGQRIFECSGFYGGAVPYGKPFFATFGYVNNAATFFMLASALALSRRGWTPVLAILFAACIWLVDCRAMAGAVCLLAALYLLMKAKADAPLLTVVLMAFVVLAWQIPSLLDCRWHEYLVNARLIEKFPLFGCGAHGSILMAQSVAEPHIAALIDAQPNSHNDYLLWLVEYGIIGFTLLTLIAITLIRNLVSGRDGQPAAAGRPLLDHSSEGGGGLSEHAVPHHNNIMLLGALLAAAHALIDMPFRNFAVLSVVVVILIPNLTNKGES